MKTQPLYAAITSFPSTHDWSGNPKPRTEEQNDTRTVSSVWGKILSREEEGVFGVWVRTIGQATRVRVAVQGRGLKRDHTAPEFDPDVEENAEYGQTIHSYDNA